MASIRHSPAFKDHWWLYLPLEMSLNPDPALWAPQERALAFLSSLVCIICLRYMILPLMGLVEVPLILEYALVEFPCTRYLLPRRP